MKNKYGEHPFYNYIASYEEKLLAERFNGTYRRYKKKTRQVGTDDWQKN